MSHQEKRETYLFCNPSGAPSVESRRFRPGGDCVRLTLVLYRRRARTAEWRETGALVRAFDKAVRRKPLARRTR